MFKQEFNDLFVDEFLCFIHFHFRCTKVMQQRVPFGFLNYPVWVCSILQQKLGNQKTNLFVFETVSFFNQSVQHCSQRIVVKRIGFIDLSFSENKVSGDFIVAIHTGDNKSSLFIVVGLLIDIYVLVFEQEPADFLESFSSSKAYRSEHSK